VTSLYGVILPTNFLKEKEEMKLKVYNNSKYMWNNMQIHALLIRYFISNVY
jgi:hypothetical protein